jgi:hypothetical protein
MNGQYTDKLKVCMYKGGFRGEYLNVKIYDVQQMQSDGNSSHGQSPCDLKSYFKIVCY